MYKISFREAVLRVYAFFGSMRMTAKVCRVSVASVCRWTRHLKPATRKTRIGTLSDAMVASVHVFMTAQTRCSAMEVVQFLKERWHMSVSRQLAHCIIRRLGFTYKRTRKRGGGHKNVKTRREFFEAFSAAFAGNGEVVAVDESGFDQRVQPVYGYSLSGTPAIATVLPCKDRHRYNLIMAIHASGTFYRTIRDSTMTGDAFAAFIASLPYDPGTTLLLDNAAIHRTAAVRIAVSNKGYTLLYTPSYSLEYNPIELVFGVIKNAFYIARYSEDFKNDLKGAVERCVARHTTAPTIRGCFKHVASLVTGAMNQSLRSPRRQ
jgi:transposase